MVDKNQLKELKHIIALCKKEGVKSIEMNGIKLEFNPYSLPTKTKKQTDDQDIKVEPQFNDEDILFWSAGGLNG